MQFQAVDNFMDRLLVDLIPHTLKIEIVELYVMK